MTITPVYLPELWVADLIAMSCCKLDTSFNEIMSLIFLYPLIIGVGTLEYSNTVYPLAVTSVYISMNIHG